MPDPADEAIAKVEALGTGDDTWKSLDKVEPDDEPGRVAASASSRAALQDTLAAIVNAEHLVVLMGSGTSIGLTSADGVSAAPSMGDLWREVQGLAEFSVARSLLSADPIERENLEHVLSDAQARLALDPDCDELSKFIDAAELIVWNHCNFIDPQSEVGTHELFLRKIGRRSSRLQRTQIYTTNYDLAIETAAGNARFNIIDGFMNGALPFDGGSFDLDFVRRRPHEQLALEPNVFHLLKLHGSVDWNIETERITKVAGRPSRPVLIYPSAAKYQLSYQQPYLEFMSRLQLALRQPNVGLLVVGFGFNDDHIVAPIESAIRSNIGLRALIASPGVRKPERARTISWVEDLIQRGDRRLSLLKGTFEDLVRFVPEVPAAEERDAHIERVSRPRPDAS